MIDIVMTATTCMLSYSLIPQVIKSYRDRKVDFAWQTVIITVVGVWILTACFFQLGLILNGFASVVTASMWTALMLMKIFRK